MKHTGFAASVLLLTLALAPFGFAQEDGQPPPRSRRPGQGEQFRLLFTLPGIEFSEDQQRKITGLREKYTPKLADVQRRSAEVETPEQRRARREAIQAAREAGKQGRELRAAAEQAVQLTAEQRQKQDDLQREQRALITEIRRELAALLTDEQRAALREALPQRGQRGQGGRGPATPPTHRDVKYGPHGRNVMDVWLAKSETPTPVLVSIHGGGFRGGNKGVEPGLLRECLDSGISVVAITYRLSGEAIAPAQFHDSARAVQFIRHKAAEWNLDPKRVAATGGSAGAGISLWLGFHDDMADPDSDDPVLRQSTRLSCMAVYNGQTSYDPRFIRDLLPGSDTYKHPALEQLYGIDADRLDDLPAEKARLIEETAPINHVTKDDPPAMLSYATEMDTPIRSQGVGIHHPKFAQVLKEKMDKLGIECRIHTGLPRGSDEWTRQTMRFIKKHLGVEE